MGVASTGMVEQPSECAQVRHRESGEPAKRATIHLLHGNHDQIRLVG
jgi:hypothetical protein